MILFLNFRNYMRKNHPYGTREIFDIKIETQDSRAKYLGQLKREIVNLTTCHNIICSSTNGKFGRFFVIFHVKIIKKTSTL